MSDLLPVMELHSVLVRFKGETDSTNEVYGEVTAQDRAFSVFIFKEDKDTSNSGNVLPDGTLSLTGPSRCMFGQPNCFFVRLHDKKTGLEISNGYYESVPSQPDYLFDQPLRIVIPGKHGFVVLHLSKFTYGVQASIRVKLLPQKGDDQSSENHLICGTMYARVDNYETNYPVELSKEYHRSTLLYASSDNPKKVHESGQLIQLSRSVVGVPDSSKLILEAELWDTYYGVPETRDADVKGMAFFFPESESNKPFTIQGSNCSIEVEVEWIRNTFREYSADKCLGNPMKEA